jgi:hypothetical protein
MRGPRSGDAFYDMPRAPGVPERWTAVVWYRTDAGLIDVEHQIEELDMLHDLVESGPDFHTIDRIEIRHTENPCPTETIESSRMK